MFAHSAQTHAAMLGLKSKNKNPVLFGFSQKKNGQNGSFNVHFGIPLLQALNLSPQLDFYGTVGFCTA